MARQSGGSVLERSPTTCTTTKRPENSRRRAKPKPPQGTVLLEPLPMLLPVTETEPKPATRYEPTEDEIRARAYQIYLDRGGRPGNEIDDWYQAECELRPRRAA
jgi:hypothetical protein